MARGPAQVDPGRSGDREEERVGVSHLHLVLLGRQPRTLIRVLFKIREKESETSFKQNPKASTRLFWNLRG